MLAQPENEEQLLDWVRDIVEDSKEARRGAETQWWEQLCIYSGDLWVEYNPHSKRLEELPKPDHRVRLPINLVSPVVRTEYAKLLKNRPIVDCIARSGDKSDLDSAKVGDKILKNYVEKTFYMPSVRRDALMWALITGLGAIFVDYDETKDGEIDVLVDPTGNPIFDPATIKAVQRHYRDKHRKPKTAVIPQGDLRIVPLGPMDWGWDLSKKNPRDAQFCWVRETYDALEVKRRWGKELEDPGNAKPNLLEQRVIQKTDLTRSIQFPGGGGYSSQDIVEVYRVFIRPGHFYFPDGAEIIFTEHEMIEARSYPHGHNQLPISWMGHIPMPGSRYPISVVSQIRDPVLELSKTESQMTENRNLMANPPWLTFREHEIEDGTLVNKPGARITIPWRPQIPEPHPIEMPEMPAYIQNLSTILREHIQEIAGQGETSQGRVPPGARSGVAIAYLQEEDDTKLGPTVSEFEEMIERVSWQVLRVIAERYDVPRTVSINRKHSHPEVFDFIGTMLSGISGVECQAGSALPRSKAAKQQFMMDLYSMGIEQDTRKVKEMLELGQGEPEEWEVDMDQADRENDRMELGQQAPVEDWFNHAAHLAVHRRFMKSPDFEALPPNIQEIYRTHDKLHQRFLTGAAQAQQAGVPVPGQSIPGAQMQNGQNNQAPVQGGPVAQNGQVPAPDQMGMIPQ